MIDWQEFLTFVPKDRQKLYRYDQIAERWHL